MPRKKLNPPTTSIEETSQGEKFFYPELLEEAKLKGDADDYYALVYRITPEGTAFESRTRADITWEEFRDTFGTGKFQFQVKHRATNAYAGQNTFRIGAPVGENNVGLSGNDIGAGASRSQNNEIAQLVRAIESLVKSLMQPKRNEIEEMLLKFAMDKLTEKQETKPLSSQIEELIALQKLFAPKSKEIDLLEAFDKRLNLVERVEKIGKKISSLDGESDDEFSVKDMVDIVKTLIANSTSENQYLNGSPQAPQTLQQMPSQPIKVMPEMKKVTPELQYQKWLSKFPESMRKIADMIAKAMSAEANHEVFIKALKSEVTNENGEIKKEYQKFLKVIKVDSEIAIDFLKSQGFPVEKHLDWTNKALEMIASQL